MPLYHVQDDDRPMYGKCGKHDDEPLPSEYRLVEGDGDTPQASICQIQGIPNLEQAIGDGMHPQIDVSILEPDVVVDPHEVSP